MSLHWDRWEDAGKDGIWRWHSFTPYEMRCQGTGQLCVSGLFMDKLQALRREYGKPIRIISGYRTPEHNHKVTKKRSMTGAHTAGRAVDIFLIDRAMDVPWVLELAKKHGMTRGGLQLSHARFKFHMDDMTAGDGFAVRDDGELYCWTY